MNYAVDYTESEASGFRWESGVPPEKLTFNPFFAKKPDAALPTEAQFIEGLQKGDVVCVLGTSVTETFCFLASAKGVKVLRAFAADLKKVKTDLGLEKDGTAQALYEACERQPEILRPYVSIPPDLHLLRRWVRMHFRFQKRFRTGLQATLVLLEKEVKKFQTFGYLKESEVSEVVEKAVSDILETAIALEERFEVEIRRSLKQNALWNQVLLDIHGVGLKIGSKIVASGPRERFKNRDHFVAASGGHVKNGRAAHREAGVILRRDPLLWDAVLQFMRKLHMNKSEWGEMYLKKKQEYLDRGWTKLRADRAARRFVGTHLLRYIWKKWQEVE